ncbi:MAG: SMP-30/gluconolactonase/LRE family protein [Caulobacterales bacterium]|nr:SMP-30/gluconolactonase/LRE family protein [Caulobacterales bacterium]
MRLAEHPSQEIAARRVFAGHDLLGEGPLWHERSGALLWTDIYGGHLNRWSPWDRTYEETSTSDAVTALAACKGGGFLASTFRRIVRLDDAFQGNADLGLDLLPPGFRFNDGKASPLGDFWVGSLAPDAAGSLYCIDPSGLARQVESGLGLCNGLDWSPDGATFYLADTAARRIYRYCMGADGRSLEDRTVFAEFRVEEGAPDGLCVDGDGCVWCAMWDGSVVLRLDPHGGRISRIPLPTPRPTSCAFGGRALRTLYVTSARHGLEGAAPEAADHSGSLFAVALGITGQPTRLCAI